MLARWSSGSCMRAATSASQLQLVAALLVADLMAPLSWRMLACALQHQQIGKQ